MRAEENKAQVGTNQSTNELLQQMQTYLSCIHVLWKVGYFPLVNWYLPVCCVQVLLLS